MSSEKSILAGSAKDRNVAETYVLVQNLTPIIQRLLANDPAVTEMRVLGFQLSGDDIQAIAYALTENKTLRALSLDHLQIGDEGAKQLSQGLCYNESPILLTLQCTLMSMRISLATECHRDRFCLTNRELMRQTDPN